jgi:hypothetical protein
MEGHASKKRGLAPRALVENEERRPASPATALVRAALEGEAPRTTERTLRLIPLDEIDLTRRRFHYRVARSLTRLQESLLRQGQQVPVILRGQAPPYEVVAGFGRCDALAAASAQGRLKEAQVWADLRPRLSDREAHEISVLENEDRDGLSELDRVNKSRKLKTEGYSISEIAAVIKKGDRMVQYYLSLGEAPAKIMEALSAGALRPTHALVLTKFAREALADLTPDEVEARLSELLEQCARGASVANLRAAVDPERKRAEAELLVVRADGFELRGFDYSPGLPVERQRALLAALEQARRWVELGIKRQSGA